MSLSLWRMHDAEPRGVFPVTPREAPTWNERGHGIFWTVNEFSGPRKVENLSRIRAWAIDIDDGTKEEQEERIQRSPLVPSLVVESKNGYHVYWSAADGTAENWHAIVTDRLVPFFGADPRARDIARILRATGYAHMKNPAAPFIVRPVHRWKVAYTEAQMLRALPRAYRQRAREEQHVDKLAAFTGCPMHGSAIRRRDEAWRPARRAATHRPR